MPEELRTSEEVGTEAPDGQVDSQEEYEDSDAEDTEAETGSQGEASPQDQEYADQDEAGESDDSLADVSELRIQEVESQLQQVTQQMNEAMQRAQRAEQYAHQLGMQQQPQAQAPRQGSNLPSDMDEWEPRRQADYVLQQSERQSQQYANQIVRQAMAQVNTVQNTTNQMIELLFETHPDKDLVLTALANMQGNQRPLDFKQSFASERGRAASQRVTVADKQLKKQSQEQDKRGRSAKKQARRPRAAKSRQTQPMTVGRALELAAETVDGAT